MKVEENKEEAWKEMAESFKKLKERGVDEDEACETRPPNQSQVDK